MVQKESVDEYHSSLNPYIDKVCLIFIPLDVIGSKYEANDHITNIYYLENESGIQMIRGIAVIDDRMKYVNIGDLVRINYNGATKNKKGRDVHMFKVEVGKRGEKKTETELEKNSPTQKKPVEEEIVK